jgi:endonuclease/exonuclease/phosphatase family metal-dependent hydrolase
MRVAFILFLSFQMSYAQPVTVMTYNIRLDTPIDGVNAWPNRADRVASLIRKYNPDILGIQEAMHHQLHELLRTLPDYSFVGVGRDDGKEQGEYSAILYKHARFGLLQQNTFWLSETSDVPGSKNWDAAITRVATWARLFDKEAKAEFLVLNTHFDHIGKVARERSAELIKVKLAELANRQPVLVMGDFNSTPEERAYQVMVEAGDFALYDATPGMPVGTFCGFAVGAMDCVPIDYIFHSKEWTLKNFLVISDNDGTHYPSDHLPVLAGLALTGQ